jgi:uncharacterized membrane protein (UPF0182 family)
MMQAPDGKGQEFVLQRPFVPRRKANQLSAFLFAGNDAENYGKLTLYEVPDNSAAPSPYRASTLIEADPNISKTFSLLDQRGSQVVRGAPQLIPVGETIFYVRPIYIEGSPTGTQKPLPRWNYVAVTYGENAVLDRSVSSAVKNLIAGTIPAVEREALNGNVSGPNETPTTTPDTTPDTTPNTTPNTIPTDASVAQLLEAAQRASDDANAALKIGDLTGWAQNIQRMQAYVNAANRKLQEEGSGGTTPTTTAPASSTTTRPKSTTTTVARA